MPWASAISRRPAHPLGRGHHEAALALHRLEDDRGHLLGRHVGGEHLPQRGQRGGGRIGRFVPVGVRVGSPVHLGSERAEAGLVGMLLGGQRHRHQGAAVEGAVEADHGRAAGGQLRDLDRVLDRLGAGVEERGLLGAGDGRPFEQPLGQLDVGLVRHHREVGVQEAVDLGVQRGRHRLVGVPHVQAADAAGPVQEGVAVHVGDGDAVSVVDHDRQVDALRIGDHALLARQDLRRTRSRQLGAQVDRRCHLCPSSSRRGCDGQTARGYPIRWAPSCAYTPPDGAVRSLDP